MARGLLNDPWILFLDEPTLGLDVAAARSIRELVLDWKAAVPGRTVLLTTHYMAEADELCERIAIVDRGRILAIGTPDELKRRVQRESIFRLELDRLDGGVPQLARLPGRRSPRRPPPTTTTRSPAGRRQPRPHRRRGARRRGHRAGRHRVAHPRPAQVGAHARGRVRRARRARLRRRGRRTQPAGPRRRAPHGDGRTPSRARHRERGGPRAGGGRRWRARPANPVFATTRSGSDPGPRPTGRSARSSPATPRALVGRAYPRVRGMVREPSWLFFEILLPFLTTSAFVLVYRALQAPEAYVGFVVLGGAMAAFWLNVVWMMAGQLYWEKSQGNLELYFAAPMNLMAILLGMAVGGLVMSSTRAAAILSSRPLSSASPSTSSSGGS